MVTRSLRPGSVRGLRPLALLLLLLPLWAAPGAAEEPCEPRLEGRASFAKLDRLGQFQVDLALTITNPGPDALTLEAANLLLCHEGGWLEALDPQSLDGSFFREPLPLASEASHTPPPRVYRVYTPAMHAVLDVTHSRGHRVFTIPILREGFEAPPPCEPLAPFGLGAVGPLEAVPFSNGSVAVLLVGQHQVLSGQVPSDVRTTLTVSGDQGSIEPVTWQGLEATGDRRALWPFVRRVEVFGGFEGGQLRVHAQATLAGRPVEATRTWPVRRVEPAVLRAPVLGAWQMSNGPGQTDLHDHYLWPQYRYAYDMVVLKQGRTHAGDPHDNESYYAWNRSVRAAADGEIVALCALERDNPGYRGALTTCYDNHVVVRHADGLHTAYLHIRKDSIAQGLRVGGRVRAGQVLARVGNSGDSSEPHLHFMAFRIDATGRWQSVPVTFANASHDAKGAEPVQGVPLGGTIYHFRDR